MPKLLFHPWLSLLAAVGVLLVAGPAARADVQTSLRFLSPSTIAAGGSVAIDFGVSFIPMSGSPAGAPQFFDDDTASPEASCADDPNPCTELQFSTSASFLSTVFAEVVAGNSLGAPNFYGFDSTGDFTLTLPYPNTGLWEITVAGLSLEEASELECNTQWDNEVPLGAPSCTTIQTFAVPSMFDPDGIPALFVTVDPTLTGVPEPPPWTILGLGLLGLAPFVRRPGWRRGTAT